MSNIFTFADLKQKENAKRQQHNLQEKKFNDARPEKKFNDKRTSNIFTLADIEKKENDERELQYLQAQQDIDKIKLDEAEKLEQFNSTMSGILKNLYTQLVFFKKLYDSKCIELEKYKSNTPRSIPQLPPPPSFSSIFFKKLYDSKCIELENYKILNPPSRTPPPPSFL